MDQEIATGRGRVVGRLGLGKLDRRTGKQDQAREHLTTAATMYREMDMPFWLEQAEAEMRALAWDARPRVEEAQNPPLQRTGYAGR